MRTKGTGIRLNARTTILSLVLLLLLVSTLFPLYWMVATSLRGEAAVMKKAIDLWPSAPSIRNYVDVWQSGPFARYFLNSVIVSAVVVFGNLLFASMVGYGIARREFQGKRIVIIAVVSMLMVPRQITMIPLYLLISKLHMMNTYFALTLPFLVDAFNVFFISQYVTSLPVELEEAARVDGASDMRIFFRIVLPLSRPALAVVAINTFLVNWNSFLYPLILTNTEGMRTLPVGLALYSLGEHSVDWGHLTAGSTLCAVPIILVFLAFQRHIIEGITAGAGK
ncbi:MAG: carbohydrate ABC transporter permease [Candidatus Eiseniibacteriota bacterium]|nr:MAG: carbohydrate ABC transporter permease [Candidatus Eisenbacteria bacterium]